MKKNKTVYIALTADSLHHGHMNLIEKARSYGEVIIGLLTDEAVAEHKRLPYLNYDQRKRILINLKGVSNVDVEFLDLQGKLILSKQKVHNQDQLNLSGIPTGTYFLKILSNEGVKQLKVRIK